MTVRLITGPPGAGKNKYVTDRWKDGNFIVDFDEIRATHPNLSLDELKFIRNGMEEVAKNFKGDAWVIRCVADAKARTELATRLNASEVVVLETPADVAKERVKERGRDPHKNEQVFTAIDDWWSQYGVVTSDVIVKPEMGDSLSDRKKTMPDIEKGYPADTPVAEMTDKEQAAYWKYHARKHENIVKEQKDYSELKEKAAKFDALNKPEDKDDKNDGTPGAPVDAAALRAEILAELRAEQLPAQVRSAFVAAVGDRLEEDALDNILEDIDLNKFVKDGSVDVERVKTKAELIAPAVRQVTRRSGNRTHQGTRERTTGSTVASGKELFEEFSKKK